MAGATALEAGQGSLHIGDTVLFLLKTKDYSGYVYSELSSTPYKFLTVYNLEDQPENDPAFPNVAFAAFKILAPNKYKAKQYLREVQQMTNIEEYELLNAIRAAQTEETENRLEQQRRFGNKVVYGDLIQLQHVASKMFVRVCSEASKTESNNLLVSLSAENFEECIFKILPRYKVRSEGDEVRFNDQLKIESVKNLGQFLHCSGPRHTLGADDKFNVLVNCFELNLSATESALTLIPHYCPSVNKHPDKALRAGTCVRLFHKEDECYIVAEGSFAGKDNAVVEDVHCRLRKVDSRKHAAPSTSSNTYWQIEKQEDPRSGDVIAWRDRCRLKHLPTRCYLAVIKVNSHWKVTLKDSTSEDDLDTIFSFSPLIEEVDEVLLESYALIKHRLSGQWLHLEKKSHYQRTGFDPTAVGLAGLQWDSAELFVLTTSKDKGDYDSFTLQEVTEDLVDRFNYVAGIVPVLTGYIKQLHNKGELKQKQAVRVRDTLRDLKKWLVADKERNTKNNQKLLRNLRVIEQLAEILSFAEAEEYKESNHHVNICRECYNVIRKFLEGDSRKNENYLAHFIEFFQTHVRKGLNAEEVLVEIVQDNITIVSRMADTQLGHMIEQFVKTEDPRFLDFLGSLCVCSDRPIPSTQSRLLHELIERHGNEKLLRTKLDKANGQIYFYHPSAPTKLTSLKQLGTNENRRNRASIYVQKDFKNHYYLLKSQLYLLTRLCQGNNKEAINALVYTEENPNGYISFDEALTCVKDCDIDTDIRSHYIELILVMFVDFGENRSFLDNLCYSFIYEELVPVPYSESGDSQVKALTGAENKHFPDIKDWILTTISDNTRLRCESAENPLLELVLDVLGHLVRYGYYDDIDDVDQLLGPLTQMLDGRTDIPSARKVSEVQFKSSTRKKDNPENRDVFSVKIKALEVMELLYRFKFYVKLQKFMHDFKMIQSSLKRTRIGGVLSTDPRDILAKLVKIEADEESGPNEKCYSPDIMNVVQERIKFLCDGNVKGGGFAPPSSGSDDDSLETVLLDLSGYDCDELVTSSLDLLTQMYFFEEELFSKAQQSQLLTSTESLKDFLTVKDDILPKLRQLLRVDTNRSNQEKIVSLLRQLQSLCILPNSVLPNKQNQIMLDNFGIVSDVMSFLLEKGDSGIIVLDQDIEPATPGGTLISVGEEVFHSCFTLLQHLCIDNLSVKKRIFNRLDDLLEMKIPVTTLSSLADLITEVFTGGPELILKVTEYHVDRIFDIIITCDEPTAQAQFMVTLEAIVKIEEVDLPVGRNQAIIIKNFCRFRDTFCPDLLGISKSMEQSRMEILNSSAESPDPKLQLLLNVTDMLAACAEGENLFVESVCQNIYRVEELVKIVSSHLAHIRKRPFLRYLIWAYMNTESDQVNSEGLELSHGEIMWIYLEHIADLLDNVSKVLSAASSGEIESLKHELQTARRRNSMSSYSSTPSGIQLLKLGSVRVPDVTDTQGHLVPGLLEYLADGVIPLLHTFYSHFFDPSTTSKEEQRENEYNISAKIAKCLMYLSKDLIEVFCSNKNLYMYQETITVLMGHIEIRERADVTDEQTKSTREAIEGAAPKTKSSSLKRLGKIVSQTDEEVLEGYMEQEKLNELFNSYSRNYHCSYMGPNTAIHQIESTIQKIEYSDEGEELPLGPSFQRLVKLYRINPSQTSDKQQHPAERLLRQLEISVSRTDQLGEAEQIDQDNLDLRCLQILRALIHNRIKFIDPELKDRDPCEFREKCDQHVVPVQNFIQSFKNAISRVVPLLSHPNESISREALALMKALLFSGNEEVQEGLAADMKDSREEKLFSNLKERLEIASLNYRETVDLEAQLRRRQQFKKKSMPGPVSTKSAEKLGGVETSVTFTVGKEVMIPMEEIDGTSEDESPLITVKSPGRKLTKAISTSSECGIGPAKEIGFNLLSNIIKRDALWTNLVLEVIGLMCDGQNRTLQDYLREQPDNFKTTNVVAEVVAFLHTFTADMSRNNFEQIGAILQSLVEMCVGNIKNQQIAFDKLVLDPLNRILQLQFRGYDVSNDDEKSERLLHLVQVKGSAVELLDVMLEEISPQTVSVAKGIGSSLDIESLLSTMDMFYQLKSHPLVRREQMDDDCERGLYKTYQVLVTLIDYKAIDIKNKKQLKEKAEKKCKDAFNSCLESSHSIEIHYEEEGAKPILARIHFPYKAELRDEVTELVRWNINRDSMEDKQRALVDLMPALKRDVLHQTKLKDTKIMKPFLAFHALRTRLLILLTIILNLFILFLYAVPDRAKGNNRPFLPDFPLWFTIVFYVLGAGHLLLALWIVVEYFIINWPHFKLPTFAYNARAKIGKAIRKDADTYTVPRMTCIDVGIFSISTLYMLLFLVCSILSLAFKGYFYCFCLLFIIVHNDILKRVLRAVTKNGMSLIWVAVLGVIVLFIYAVISFAFLQNNYVRTDDAALYCANLGQCMYSVLRYGLTDNLGLLIPFQNDGEAPENFDTRTFTARLIFDLSFFIIVTTIGLNIVFGIIVDTFSELREERNNIETEQKSKCFICDLPSYDFERRAKGFSDHVKHDHNMWKYVYYSLYLDSIDTGDHNAIQKYVYELIGNNDTAFFPQEEARCLIGEEDTTGEKIDELEQKVEKILRHFREKEHKKSLNVKRQEQTRWEQEVLHKTRDTRHISFLSPSPSISFDKQ
ncbi:PREDICTED: uncharacterized protein LOC100634093 isoform X2 [Amphimedon queenslandica]|uniref:Inositol 1,4,5-trisphosphate receptor type 1 n=1 Tax=Amphimedon queenslandica TaxID=400682 RepID=A0A1X7VNQ3_AMPQE|nr:PREDICTED: uncharacterized protein LOC100634093 isoform X2 [Amphimedon queenslandica]|eukprot:XP_019861438.1 PREDICTED: uncharacterized protein LOC100634093 isoform X2 [Amphimedon queenslandica]